MLTGANLFDGSNAHMPFGWVDGDTSRNPDGTIPFNPNGDTFLMGNATIAGLEDDTDYVLIFNLDNPDGVEIYELGLPDGPYTFSHDGGVVLTFHTSGTSTAVNFRAEGMGAGTIGPIEIRQVTAP